MIFDEKKQIIDGWFFSEQYHHWQKRQDKVYCYVTPIFGGVKAQLYLTGTASFCSLEARTNQMSVDAFDKMFTLAQSWLDQYSDGNIEAIQQDKFSIDNPEGVWRKNTEKKEWWI